MEITDIQVQKKNKHRVSVFVDNEYSFSLDEIDCIRLQIKTGKKVTPEDIKKYNLESNLSKARNKALDIISRRDICERELKNKLRDKGYDEMITDIVIDELSALGYIDDYEYALKFIEEAIHLKSNGRIKIKYDLSKKGVSEDIIRKALSEFDEDPAEMIAEIISSRYSGVDLNDFKNKQKITRYLAGRGYDFSEINEGIRRAKEDEIE
jgi:regulatory protein